MRERLSAAFDRFIDVRTKSDRDVALLSRDLQIDIAVDMKGFTKDSRPGIFAHRAAAIQVNFLGYPGSMGARYIDYIIADRTLIPEASRPCYSEKVVYLPDSYQVNDARRPPPAPAPARALLNLPGDAFVFCCFNSSYKMTAGVFDSWMRILAKTGRSVLWLLVNGASTAANLRNAAEARGVDASRLIFAPFTQPAQHLSRLGAADLFLDTFPCNAHTTASDALWAGVPVVTRLGESFASRVAGSLLHGIGLSELITTSVEQYEEVATALADNPGLLSKVKMKLLGNRPTASLFNTGLFTGRLEDAYRQMYRRHHSGLEPEDIHVAGRNERGGPQPPG